MRKAKQKDFLDLFPPAAEAALAKYPHLSWNWKKEKNQTLMIGRQNESGFDVAIVCETYGLYPLAGDWHGCSWDITAPGPSTAEKCEECLQFILHLLSPNARLKVLTSNRKPYRWRIECFEKGEWKLHEETGLLIFNYFGLRSEFILQNNQIPSQKLHHA